MEKVIHYTEEIANSKNYLYIKPNGEIVKSPYDHYVWPECFCAIYCNGLKISKNSKKTKRSKLNEKEIVLLKEYLNAFNNKELTVDYDSLYETFLISVLSYDKINLFYKTIRTTSNEPEHKYKSYIENGWKIEVVPSIVRDEDGYFYWNKENSKGRILSKNNKNK